MTTLSPSTVRSDTLSPPPLVVSTQQDWSPLLKQLLNGDSLSLEQSAALMEGWVAGTVPPTISGAILGVMQSKGVSATELAGMTNVMRSLIAYDTPLPALPTPLVDTCGTGGDGASTFNISTAVAFVVAAAGVNVAKHGNRSASSKAGSADVLEALGINLSAKRERTIEAIEAVGITFLFAPGWHPAFKAIAPLRKTLKIRTIFNLLGPLLNPLPITGQVIGVSSPALVRTVAEALSRLDVENAIVVHGREGLDEAGLADLSNVATIEGRQIEITAVGPRMLDLQTAATADIKGGDVNTNADILKALLQGKGTQAQQDVVAFNAALALKAGEVLPANLQGTEALKQGVSMAKEILSSGEAWRKLEQLAQFL